MVPIPSLEDPSSFLTELENSVETATRPIRALILSNPHNPLGRCFSQEQLEACLKFCQAHSIHLISDEIFGPMTFESPDLPPEERFVSVLSLDCEALRCDPSRVHMIWSPSKVFSLSGLRLVRLSLPIPSGPSPDPSVRVAPSRRRTKSYETAWHSQPSPMSPSCPLY